MLEKNFGNCKIRDGPVQRFHWILVNCIHAVLEGAGDKILHMTSSSMKNCSAQGAKATVIALLETPAAPFSDHVYHLQVALATKLGISFSRKMCGSVAPQIAARKPSLACLGEDAKDFGIASVSGYHCRRAAMWVCDLRVGTVLAQDLSQAT